MQLLMPQFIKRIKRRAICWLANQIAWEKAQACPRPVLTIEATSTLSDEAQIVNGTGEKGKIQIGEHCFVRGRLLTFGHGGCIQIGNWCYVGHRTEIWSMDSIVIGNNVMIAHDVNIVDGTAHPRDPVDRHVHYRHLMAKGFPKDPAEVPGVTSAPIVIEDDVWINFGVTILKGVRIGRGSIIAAKAIVTKDVPSGVLYRCEVKPIITPL
jgi:acetyltransferase-like isoleucine patch superfamily enzyme